MTTSILCSNCGIYRICHEPNKKIAKECHHFKQKDSASKKDLEK